MKKYITMLLTLVAIVACKVTEPPVPPVVGPTPDPVVDQFILDARGTYTLNAINSTLVDTIAEGEDYSVGDIILSSDSVVKYEYKKQYNEKTALYLNKTSDKYNVVEYDASVPTLKFLGDFTTPEEGDTAQEDSVANPLPDASDKPTVTPVNLFELADGTYPMPNERVFNVVQVDGKPSISENGALLYTFVKGLTKTEAIFVEGTDKFVGIKITVVDSITVINLYVKDRDPAKTWTTAGTVRFTERHLYKYIPGFGADIPKPTGIFKSIDAFDMVNDIDKSITADPILGIPGVTQTRIPSILQLASDRILVMFDARSTSQADAANDIDTGIRYTDDLGKSWSKGLLVNWYQDFAVEHAATTGRKMDSASFIDSSPVQAANGDIVSLSTLFPGGSGIQGGARHPADNPFIRENGITYLRLTKTSEYPYQGSAADDKAQFKYKAPVLGGAITKINDNSETGYKIDKNWYVFLKNDQPVEVDQLNAKTPTKVHANIAFSTSPFRNIRSSYIALNRSTNNGTSWTIPVDISHFFRPATDNQHYIVSPGVGLKLREGEHKGRLVYVLYETPGNATAPSNPATGGACNAFSIYSDDNGLTWKQGGYTKPASGLAKVSESQVIEAPGGQLLMYSRGGSKISLAHSVDGGVTWTQAVNTGMNNGQGSGTQFGVISLYYTVGARGERLAAMIHPDHPTSRRDGTVRTGQFKKSGQKVEGTSIDEWIVDWDTTTSIYAKEMPIAPSAENFGYSSVAELNNGNLGIFFEGVNSYTTGLGELNYAEVKLIRDPIQ